jgi:hypothetical protein
MNSAEQTSLETSVGAELVVQLSRASAALQGVLSGREQAIDLTQLTRAFAEVQGTRTLLESSSPKGQEFATALAGYQLLLRQFKAELPRLHGWLLAERGRLAGRRSHSSGVENWLESNRQTR